MYLKADASQLEWRTKVFLSQDEIGIRELQNNEDLHSDNQRFFQLPSRIIAKIFLYRMIFADAFGPREYEGPAFAYARDPDFSPTSSSVKYWTGVVSRFFEKYEGVHKHSIDLISKATQGPIVSPSGREYRFQPYTKKNGEIDWPRTDILNYPVQGLAADFMIVARGIVHQRIKPLQDNYGHDRILLVNTVHDDIELDVDNDPEIIYNISRVLEQAFQDVPEVFEKWFHQKVNVPLAGEVKFGTSLLEDNMVKFNPKTFEKDFKEYYERTQK